MTRPGFICPQCGVSDGASGACPADGTILQPRNDDDFLGTTVGSYRITKLLGIGGMGRVYKAVHPAIGSRVAIKVLINRSDELVRRFFAEARAVNVIRHQHIVNIHDLAMLPDGRPYIVMEYLDGQPLSALIAESGGLAPEAIGCIGAQILDALAAVHGHNIVHRDLKPDNIFIAPNGNVKVLDFGIAKLDSNEGTPTEVGTILGTPLYVSPEQALGKPVDGRSDLYSLGVILYQAATGQTPFTADSIVAILRMHIEQRPPPACALRPDLPPALGAVIARALEKQPSQRYPSAQAMAAALAAATKDARSAAAPRRPLLQVIHSGSRISTRQLLGIVLSMTVVSITGVLRAHNQNHREPDIVTASSALAVADRPASLALQPAAVQLDRKLSVYIDCLDSVSPSAQYARSWYGGDFNMVTGPTGHESRIYGVRTRLDEARPCADAVRGAASAPPKLPELEAQAEQYASVALDLASVQQAAYVYYGEGDYKDDYLRKGKALHPQLVAGWEALARADRTLRWYVKAANRKAHEDELVTIEREQGRARRYFVWRLMLAAESLADQTNVSSTAVTRLDEAKLNPIVEEYQRTVLELSAYEAAVSPGGSDGSDEPANIRLVEYRAKGLALAAKYLMRRVREKRPLTSSERTGHTELVEGAPAQLSGCYNSLADEVRAFEYWTPHAPPE